jgi:anti-anti-sigma factor
MEKQPPEAMTRRNSCRTNRIDVQIHAEALRIIRLRGEHDLGTARAIEVALAKERGHNILVDLSCATFIDSSVINTLLRSRRTVRDRAGSVELVAACRSFPHRVLELAGVHKAFTVHEDLAAGLASMDARLRVTAPQLRGISAPSPRGVA